MQAVAGDLMDESNAQCTGDLRPNRMPCLTLELVILWTNRMPGVRNRVSWTMESLEDQQFEARNDSGPALAAAQCGG